jgi:hypothetical protein
MAAGAAASGASAPAGNFRPRVLLAGLLAAVVALVGAGILALARPPGEADRPGAGRLRQTSDATRLAEALREPGLDVVSTVSLRNDTILVDPPYDILSRIDVGSAASIASRALGGDAVVRCRFGILSMTAMIRGTYEQAVPVWMCVQVAPVLFLAGGVPRRLVAVSFVHAVDGHRFLEIREPA